MLNNRHLSLWGMIPNYSSVLQACITVSYKYNQTSLLLNILSLLGKNTELLYLLGTKKQLPPLLAIQNCWKNQFGLMVHILWHAHRHMHPGTVVQQRCRDFFLECLVWWNFFSCSFKTFNYLFHMRTQTFDASLYLFYRQIWPAWSFKKCKSISAFFSPCKLNVSRF